jgi:monomeric sarcosine oxidase
MERFDAIVLGTGGIGSAALYHLARSGAHVVGIDRFHPPHDRGSSHGQTRVIRQAYFEHPDYVPLLVESYRGWHELEQWTQRKLFHQVGLIQAGPADGVVIPGVLRAAATHHLPVERMTAVEINRRWPGLRVPDNMIGAFEPAAGYLLVEKCVEAHLEAACAAGAQIMYDTEVESWHAEPGEVLMRVKHGEIAAKRLVITAGAWAAGLLAELKVALPVRRKSLFWFATDFKEYMVGALPVFLFELPQGVFYGFPKLDERGLKIAEHTGGQTVADPLAVNRSVDPDERRRLIDVLDQYLPGVTHRVTDHSVCLYTMSPDENFIVDRHPVHANVVFAAGLSGHGFKFAPVLGRTLAELALQGETTLPIAFLSLARFSSCVPSQLY